MFPPSRILNNAREALVHLYEHRECGDIVPEYAFDRLKKELRWLKIKSPKKRLKISRIYGIIYKTSLTIILT